MPTILCFNIFIGFANNEGEKLGGKVMKKKETFSLRKYKIGTVSVLLGAVFLFAGAPSVAADELTSLVETKVEATVPDAIVSESASESPVAEELVDMSSSPTTSCLTPPMTACPPCTPSPSRAWMPTVPAWTPV